MFDTTALIQSKEKYEGEVENLRNVVIAKFRDVDFLRQFDWNLCIISGTVRAKIPNDWSYFMRLIEPKGYPSPILGLEAPYEMIRIRFNGKSVWLHLLPRNREMQFGFARFLNADLKEAKTFFRNHIRDMTETLQRNDLEYTHRKELKEKIEEYKDSLKELNQGERDE